LDAPPRSPVGSDFTKDEEIGNPFPILTSQCVICRVVLKDVTTHSFAYDYREMSVPVEAVHAAGTQIAITKLLLMQ